MTDLETWQVKDWILTGWQIVKHPRVPLLMALSGAHVYGNPRPDSDVDLRGVHLIPLREFVGLRSWRGDTFESTFENDGVKYDVVTHEIGKAVSLLLKGNGNILEMFLPRYQRVSSFAQGIFLLASKTICKRFASHYKGLGDHMRHHLLKEKQGTDWYKKRVFYGYRSVLCGWRLMDTGSLEPNLYKLAEHYNIDIEAKMAQPWDVIGDELADMIAELDRKQEESFLPDNVPEDIKTAYEDRIVELRLSEEFR